MDTWSIARLALDLLFALLIAGCIVIFLYLRECKLRDEFVGVLAQPAIKEPEPQSESAPDLRTNSDLHVSRAEKYLEAVRMYRNGSERKDIERHLGISLLELELLGKVK
ncbi:MAG: hypothetical protein KAT58_03310 [candidate division Zixibacteria bacterium]|nr:hypothetical protein [candidate division Zixibacteria bacterium]